MAEIKVTKLEAAQRQIDAAILMLYRGDDPVAVHTVISAACRIIRDLCSRANTSTWQKFDEVFIPGKQREAWGAFSRAANFFKHADRDPDDILEGVQEEVNDYLIFLSLALHEDLGQRTIRMRTHMAWMMLFYPDAFDMDLITKPHPDILKAAYSPSELTAMTRQQKLSDGLHMLDLAHRMANTARG
jgi:hypothetical protein